MTVTIRPGPEICKFGPHGQMFWREKLTPEAALYLAGKLLNEASLAMRDARVSRHDTAPYLTPQSAWFGDPRDMPKEDVEFFGLDGAREAPCDCDDTH